MDAALARLADQVLTARAARGRLRIVGGDTKAFYGNPATGEPVQIKASKKVAFRAAKELKESI